ncbi:aminoglycoside phosphotransferase family protein [Actinomadura scrupuli]|uniref:aminoglycoside phosphotransferase family protein n=1 Tax=Actinomadura scrupuli TaxID=559629 RepID=UPI003D975DD7
MGRLRGHPEDLEQANGSGVFLMTRILPGTTAWATDGPDNSRKFGDLLRRLHHPGLPAGPRLKDMAEIAEMRLDWARERFADPRYANDIASIKDAERVLDALLRTTTTRHVLHADLQAKNILRGPDDWFAIDPLGATGDLNAEAALWMAIQDGPATTEDRLNELRDPRIPGHRPPPGLDLRPVRRRIPPLPTSFGTPHRTVSRLDRPR